jgi:hypothetical protein
LVAPAVSYSRVEGMPCVRSGSLKGFWGALSGVSEVAGPVAAEGSDVFVDDAALSGAADESAGVVEDGDGDDGDGLGWLDFCCDWLLLGLGL